MATLLVTKAASELDPPWLFQAFFGVFGFEGIIKNLNISFLDKGVLTFSDWLDKAKNNASAQALEQSINHNIKLEMRLAERLRNLPLATLNAYLLTLIGNDAPQALAAQATASQAHEALVKGLALAQADYTKASAIR
ncbi:hypothetical protein DYGSA30_36780 [Dyella sp. GSA-30]|nr:hypothetical protein DYGSA30_36780 [Dyella sp. GSA-30]